ncbi:S1 RNA-binding domain-containing protein [Limosilactobacillus mucosae]|uniref:CvfB family protein n=1 Tax=Limosilactobacillus mucosae TaxID=97478 RepID=UPI003991BF4F
MNSVLGKVVDAVMIDENDHDYFVQPARNGQTYRLPKDESPQVLHIGGSVRGFVYENENHQLQMTCQHIPTVQVDHYDFGTVVGVRRDLGVFVDIGLPNKDIVVSLDDLPSLKHLWPQKGDRLMMALKVDDKNRIWGQLADESVFEAIANRPDPRMKNKDVKATVYRLKMAGTFVITDDYCLGFIHPSERDQEPRLGQRVSARVIGLSSHGSLNLSLKPRAYQAIGEDAQMLLEMLRRTPNHTLPFTDKSDPETIRQEFGISKGQFKRAVGHLLKARMVSMVNGKLILIKDPDDK